MHNPHLQIPHTLYAKFGNQKGFLPVGQRKSAIRQSRRKKKRQAPEAIGYHGTRLEYAQKILNEDFRPSENSWEWLGHGVYFWQDAPERALAWATEWHGRAGYKGPIAVVAARIQLFDFVDLLDQAGMKLVKNFASEFVDKLLDDDRGLVNNYPIHRLDCELFNSMATVLLSKGIEFVASELRVSKESRLREAHLSTTKATYSSQSSTRPRFWRNG